MIPTGTLHGVDRIHRQNLTIRYVMIYIYIIIYYAFNLGFSKHTLLNGTYMYPLHPLTPFHSRVNHLPFEMTFFTRHSPIFATAAHLSKHLGTCKGIQIIILRLPWWRLYDPHPIAPMAHGFRKNGVPISAWL